LSRTSMTPRAINATPSTASCSAQVRTWPVSVMTLSWCRPSRRCRPGPAPSGPAPPGRASRRPPGRCRADFDVVPDVADTGQAGHRRCGGGALGAVGHGAGQGDVAVPPSATRSSAPSCRSPQPSHGTQARHLDPRGPRLRDPPHRHADPLPQPRHHARRSSRINNILSMAEMHVSSQARPAGRGRRWVPAPRRRPRQLRRAAVIATVLS
jgi:hypothetical protein